MCFMRAELDLLSFTRKTRTQGKSQENPEAEALGRHERGSAAAKKAAQTRQERQERQAERAAAVAAAEAILQDARNG
jgi:hypothetical protein